MNFLRRTSGMTPDKVDQYSVYFLSLLSHYSPFAAHEGADCGSKLIQNGLNEARNEPQMVFVADNNPSSSYVSLNRKATCPMRKVLIFGTFLLVAFTMNKRELRLHLHRQKWISYAALTLGVLSLILALIIGMGVLLTLDLSGNIS